MSLLLLGCFLISAACEEPRPDCVLRWLCCARGASYSPFLCSLFYRICRTCALPREHYFASSQRSLMVCCRQTMVCREQTIVWWEQTMVCRRQTTIMPYAGCGEATVCVEPSGDRFPPVYEMHRRMRLTLANERAWSDNP